MIEGVHFQPWMPKGDERFQGLRLLLLGESHYDNTKTGTFDLVDPGQTTNWVVETHGVIGKKRTRFFSNVYTALTGQVWASESPNQAAFWHSVYFYNYVQEFVGWEGRVKPTTDMWKRGREPFRSVIQAIKPDVMLVLGVNLWKTMDELNATRLASDDLPLNPHYLWDLGGKTTIAAHIRHPSSHGFSPMFWYPQVKEFLGHAARTIGV